MKVCLRCKKELPAEAFYKRGGSSRSECKVCARAMTADWYSRNASAVGQKVREWRAANADRVRAYRAENRRRDYFKESARKYGFAAEQFTEMAEKQGNSCATCRVSFDWSNKQTKPHIDHCHATSKVRGLLCNRCNSVLGLVADSGALLGSLAEYLSCHG